MTKNNKFVICRVRNNHANVLLPYINLQSAHKVKLDEIVYENIDKGYFLSYSKCCFIFDIFRISDQSLQENDKMSIKKYEPYTMISIVQNKQK